jgi:hypothetical protein
MPFEDCLEESLPLPLTLFERPLLPGWVYPCTLEEIHEQLAQVPAADLEGLQAVGLVPSTRKDWKANARYSGGDEPVILIYSFAEDLVYKHPPHVRRGDLERGLGMELAFGMEIERMGARWFCRWHPENWRRFILEHVLLHEIGHHVQHMQRRRDGHSAELSVGVKEQFAEAYACRLRRSLSRTQ